MNKKIRNQSVARRKRRHLSIRRKLVGTPERPRVCVYRSNAHIYAQIIDDTTGRTIAAVSSLGLDPSALAAPAPAADEGKKKGKGKGKEAKAAGQKMLQARAVGRLLAETAKEKGIGTIAFDRAGYLFHGRVAALAQAARENGLDF